MMLACICTFTAGKSDKKESEMQGSSHWNVVRGQKKEVTKEMIVTCCDQNDVTTLRLWASQGIGVLLGGALLDIAAAYVKLAVVRFLVEEVGANINRTGLDGSNPLLIACVNAHLNVMRMLVNDFGADVDHAMQDGSTPLFIAAHRGNLNVVCCLGQELRADVNKATKIGAAPLYVAAQKGHMNVVRYLVKDLGARVNQAIDAGATPISISAHQGNLNVVRCLVKQMKLEPRHCTLQLNKITWMLCDICARCTASRSARQRTTIAHPCSTQLVRVT
jgi:hypothetical protein